MKKLFLSFVLLLVISFSAPAFSIDIQEDTDVGIEQVTNDTKSVVLVSISVNTEILDQNTLETDSIDSYSNIVNRQSLIVFVISKEIGDNLIKKRDYITYNKYLKNSENSVDKFIKSKMSGNSLFYILRSA